MIARRPRGVMVPRQSCGDYPLCFIPRRAASVVLSCAGLRAKSCQRFLFRPGRPELCSHTSSSPTQPRPIPDPNAVQTPRDPSTAITAAAKPADRGGWMRLFDWRHGQAAILIAGGIFVVIATLYGIAEEAYEEQLMVESSTAPFRNAVEREFAKYGTMQSVAALTMDPIATASGESIRTYLMGETLESLYPAVKRAND